jgi:hypothetical protein
MATSQNPGATSDPTQSVPTSMTPEELQTQITSGLTTADGAVTQSTADLKLVHQARVANLTRTAAFLAKKYGATDPRVKAAQDAVAAGNITVARVSMTHQQLSTVAPQVAANGWSLYGRVFNSHLQPAAGYTVFLVDAQKTYQQTYGFSYTDSTGYFQIDYAGAKAGTAPTGKSTAGAKAAAAAALQVFVEIVNASAQPVYLNATAFQPVTGKATYQNIVLPVGEKPIGDPPAEIRAVAIPNAEKKS